MITWLPVPGWEGYYEVSDDGRVRSVDRTVPHPISGMRRLRGREMRQATAGTMGYFYVTLTRAGERTNAYLHTMVLEAFVGPAPEATEACHGPAGHLVNTVANLRWGTRSENMLDAARRDMTHAEARKVNCKRGHRLVWPNLVGTALRRGVRKCRACEVAHNRTRRGGDMQVVSDAVYANLMALVV